MKVAVTAILFASSLASSYTLATEKLAQSSGCMGCHTIERKIIGPAFKEVSQKYQGNKTAAANLINKVKSGGSGVWGPVPMPPNPHVKDEDVKAIVQWILALK